MTIKYQKLTENNKDWLYSLTKESENTVQIKDDLLEEIIDLEQRLVMIQFTIDNYRTKQTSIDYFERIRLETIEELNYKKNELEQTKTLIQSQYDFIDMLNKARFELYEK